MANLPNDICDLIQNCFKVEVKNCDVEIHEDKKRLEGYRILVVSLTNKTSGFEQHLMVKKIQRVDSEFFRKYLASLFSNEIHFYTKLWPEMLKFHETFPNTARLDPISKFHGFNAEKSILILEDLKHRNYQIHPSEVPLGSQQYEEIFTLYGRFHALSFAYKNYKLNEFLKLAATLDNVWIDFAKDNINILGIKDTFKIMKHYLQEKKEEAILKKIEKYVENGVEIFANSVEYTGPYSIITHGNCWSKYLRFKYNDSKQIEDIKLINFLMCRPASPVYDLVYTFYSGASKECMKNWSKFLRIYHDSLSKSLKEYNLDAQNIYPYKALVSEWKEQSQFPFIMALLTWGVKFICEKDMLELDVTEHYKNKKLCVVWFDLVKHFYDNDFLL